ncbi:MAG: ribosomal RNA small subunit methyltransferase A, partial [Alphaproteobacteria bacterium]
MTSSLSLPPLRDVIARHELGARKSLGQHFLLDLNLTGRIARAAGDLGQGTVIEIGPGPGGLTRSLLEQGAGQVIAIERDARCIEALGELGQAFPGRLQVIEGDALTVEAADLGTPPRRIIAN